jgi:DNA polymerase-3 subunit alpha
MAALISSVMSTKDKVPFFVARCEEMGIEILPPDINVSDHEFTVVDGNIRFGLDAVKGVGYQAVEAIKRAREDGGLFRSLWDFCERVDSRAVNKKAIESLVKCGALGSTGASRRGMLEVLEQAQGAGQKAQQDAMIGQASIFDLGDGDAGSSLARAAARPSIPMGEFDQHELLAVEKEAIGLFISAHPLKAVRDALRLAVDCPLLDLASRPDKDQVTVGGIVTAARKVRSRSGTDLIFATLDDLEGQAELLAFEASLEKLGRPLEADQIVLVRGRVDHKEGQATTVVAQSVELFSPGPEEVERARIAAREAALPKNLHVEVSEERRSPELLSDLRHVLASFPGKAEVVVKFGETRLRLGDSYRVEPSASLRAELEQLTGAPARLVA